MKNYILSIICIFAIALGTSCQKETLSPTQDTVIVKNFDSIVSLPHGAFIIHELNKEFDTVKYSECIIVKDPTVSFTVSGSVNVNLTGDYPLTFIVSSHGKVVSTSQITVHVSNIASKYAGTCKSPDPAFSGRILNLIASNKTDGLLFANVTPTELLEINTIAGYSTYLTVQTPIISISLDSIVLSPTRTLYLNIRK